MDKAVPTQFKAMACPHCQALVAIHLGQMERVHKCPKCQKTFLGREAVKPSAKTNSAKFEDLQLAGRQLGNYLLQQMIGHGACGAVYRAQDVMLKRTVAIKVLPPTVSQQDEVSLKRFLQEAQLAAQLLHPNVVQIYYISHEEGLYYICMEYVDGGNLADRLHGGRWISPRRAMNYMAQAAEALRVAHQRGILHRDIKPANLMLTTDGIIKVADFGLAKLQGAEVNLTQERRVVGTPQYMSPEQCRGEPATAASDIYALGVTFFHALTGSPPYVAESLMGVAYKHIHDPVPDPRSRRPNITEGVANLIMRCMAKKPADRFPDAEALKLICDNSAAQMTDETVTSSANLNLGGTPNVKGSDAGEDVLSSQSKTVDLHQITSRPPSDSALAPLDDFGSPLSCFGLKQCPFQLEERAELFFQNAATQQALDSLLSQVELHTPLVILTGPNGSGKSTLLKQLASRLQETAQVFMLHAPELVGGSLIQTLGREMDPLRNGSTQPAEVMKALLDRQTAGATAQKPDVVTVDDVDELAPSIVTELKTLCEFITTTNKMSLILAGRDNLPEKLSAAGIALPLVNPSILKLEPFSPAELLAYLRERLNKSGIQEETLHFTEAALDTIHHYSRGWPGKINLLCHNALILAGSIGEHRITATMILRALQKPSFISKPEELPSLEDEHLGIFCRPEVIQAIRGYHNLQSA